MSECKCIPGKALLLRVADKPFRCRCGAKVFYSKHDDKYGCLIVCNACGMEYTE